MAARRGVKRNGLAAVVVVVGLGLVGCGTAAGSASEAGGETPTARATASWTPGAQVVPAVEAPVLFVERAGLWRMLSGLREYRMLRMASF